MGIQEVSKVLQNKTGELRRSQSTTLCGCAIASLFSNLFFDIMMMFF